MAGLADGLVSGCQKGRLNGLRAIDRDRETVATAVAGDQAVVHAIPPPTVLAIDDSPENLAVVGELLNPDYRVLAATSGEGGLRIAFGRNRPDLILLDLMMPGMDGYEVLNLLRANDATRDIPVIIVTATEGSAPEVRGLNLGAVDYITKPIVPTVMLSRVRTHMELKRARDRLADQNGRLEAEVARRMAENDLIQTIGIRALAYLAETRDPETGNHIHRTQGFIQCLAMRLRSHARFSGFLTPRNIDLLTKSAPLHDIGKVGIPDNILRKQGPLTSEEWEIMKGHAWLGADALERAVADAERPVPFLALAKEIAHWHHEKWDGSGYPDGLAGDSIPIAARLMALADVFDALISPRVYKAAMSPIAARGIIVSERGRHFDPDIADAFLADFDEFVAVAERYRDNDR